MRLSVRDPNIGSGKRGILEIKGWMKNATVSEIRSKATDLVKVKSKGVYR